MWVESGGRSLDAFGKSRHDHLLSDRIGVCVCARVWSVSDSEMLGQRASWLTCDLWCFRSDGQACVFLCVCAALPLGLRPEIVLWCGGIVSM